MRFFIIALVAFSHVFGILTAHAAFFNIHQGEKNEMTACVFYLYLKKNQFCSDNGSPLTEEFYHNAMANIRDAYAHTYKSKASLQQNVWEASLPHKYNNFGNFKATVDKICRNGKTSCQKIFTNSRKTRLFKRKKCDSLCNRNTCRDLYTLSSCYALSNYNINGGIDSNNQPICPPSMVKNCLFNSSSLDKNLEKKLLPLNWNNLEESWANIFLVTCMDPAAGKTWTNRLVKIGATSVLVIGAAVLGRVLTSSGLKILRSTFKEMIHEEEVEVSSVAARKLTDTIIH